MGIRWLLPRESKRIQTLSSANLVKVAYPSILSDMVSHSQIWEKAVLPQLPSAMANLSLELNSTE